MGPQNPNRKPGFLGRQAITATVLLILVIGIQSSYSKKIDTDLVFEDNVKLLDDNNNVISDKSQSNLVNKRSVSDNSNKIELVDDNGTINDDADKTWISRIKRSISQLWNNDDLDDVTTKSTVTKSKKHHKNLKQKAIDNETTSTQKPTKHHPKKYAPELARKRRQFDEDDEDDDDEDNDGSGSTSIETTTEKKTDDPKDDKYFRMKITVQEPWLNQYENKGSEEFVELSKSLKDGLEQLYDDKNQEQTSIMVRLVDVQQSNINFEIFVTLDIAAEANQISGENLKKIVHDEIVDRRKIGDHTMSIDNFSVTNLEGYEAGMKDYWNQLPKNTHQDNSISDENVDEDEEDYDVIDCEEDKFSCNRIKECIPLDQRCDGVKNCKDESDELNCEDYHKSAESEYTETSIELETVENEESSGEHGSESVDNDFIPIEVGPITTVTPSTTTVVDVEDNVEDNEITDDVVYDSKSDNEDEDEDEPVEEEEVEIQPNATIPHEVLPEEPIDEVIPEEEEPSENEDEDEKEPTESDYEIVEDPISKPVLSASQQKTTTEAPETEETEEISDQCRGDDKFRCGKTSIFICEIEKCDGTENCPNGEDEIGCHDKPVLDAGISSDNEECETNEFACDGSRCIPKSKQCDNVHDCDDQTDEHDCPEGPRVSTTEDPIRVASTYRDANVKEEKSADVSHLKIFKRLTELRRLRKVLQDGSFDSIADNNLLIYKREIPGKQMFVVLNLGTEDQNVNLQDYYSVSKSLLVASVTSVNAGIRHGRLFKSTDSIRIPKDSAVVFE